MEYQTAYKLAMRYQRLLRPGCEDILLVGSLRRANPKALTKGVHDIEFLIIPKMIEAETQGDLFGNLIETKQISLLDLELDKLKRDGEIFDPIRKANGPRYKKFAIPGGDEGQEFCLELWIVTPETWGIQAVIRTGPSEFSYAFVNSERFVGVHKASGKRIRGLLPYYYEYLTGETRIAIRETHELIDTSTEEAALKVLGLNQANDYWLEPSERYLYVKEVK